MLASLRTAIKSPRPKHKGASRPPSLSHWLANPPLAHSGSASQAMLYATDGIDSPEDLAKPMVGIANVWCVASLSASDVFVRCAG